MAEETQKTVDDLADVTDDFSRWYLEVIQKAQLADYSPVRGCIVFRPYGFAIWEHMQRLLDARIKATGHENAYFPLLIPESLLQKEADHIEGFAPQVAWVTHGGEDVLEERLAIRPTSEAIIGTMYAKWIDSWRDLPLLINQWANVMRWEKVTRPFLRTAEFLWQEGHTAHRTAEEAQEETLKMLEVYRAFAEEDLAMPVHKGAKTASEKFPGADQTYSIEALMRDGKALQAGTSHNLGQHFARVYDITFQDQDGERRHVHQTSWGVSTRLIGAIIMSHGDDQGLRLPPRVAPVQAVIVPIYKKDEEKAAVLEFAARVRDALLAAGVRVKVDDRDQHTPGWKYNEWELRGVPVRVEVGPRDVAKQSVVFVRRDDRAKAFVPFAEVGPTMIDLLETLQQSLFDRAHAFRAESTRSADDLAAMGAILREHKGFVAAHWCGEAACEAAIKAETSATIRNLPLDTPEEAGGCVRDGKPSRHRVLFARSY
ncbi:MAG: proline--tRNA ligase [Candidatus Eisenbacteria bacterium]